MGKQKTVGVSASWENAQVHIFCDICIREIDLGNRPTTHFSKEGWKNVIDNFKARTGLTYDRAQLKNKWDQLKRDWKLCRDLKRGETGLGWNPIKKTIDASDEWWKERIEMLPAAKKIRFVGIAPDLEEKLDRMFSQVVANGENVWIPCTGAMPPAFNQHDYIFNNIGSSDEHVVEDLTTQPPASDDICSSGPKDPISSTSSQGSKRSRNGRSFKDKGKK
ncbi:hypothetical protein KSP39_PZI011519 [Platanthera zijinensis]|uniref:Myb/SANT-like domain-containing protein n=1 Tax=Platanthera zijinensis TaxID=2320716 RepID=A0AAP0BGG7_9ASPA